MSEPTYFIYKVRVEHLTQAEHLEIIKLFTSLGWEYQGLSNNFDVHLFLDFSWNKNKGEPIMPEGYELGEKRPFQRNPGY